MASDLFFDGFRGNLVTGAENDQILEPANDAPVPRSIHLALVTAVKPSIAQNISRLLRTVPVARKNIWPPDDDLIIVVELHLNPRDCRTDAARGHVIGILHRAAAGRLRQPQAL